MKRPLLLAAVLAAAVLSAPAAFAGADGDGPCPPRRRALAERFGAQRFGPQRFRGRLERGPDAPGGFRGRMLRHRMRHRARAGLLAARLGITDEQKAAFAQAREATAKVREDARASLRALRLEARKGEPTEATRAALREKVASIRASAREAVAPEARKLLASVTPEQRARWAEAAARRGRTLDDEAILRRIERRLLGPGGRGHGQHRHGPRPR